MLSFPETGRWQVKKIGQGYKYMKILIVFIDMVRVDHLNLYNEEAEEGYIDRFLRKLGGTIYTKCYTPGPDTPRSMACLQTGLFPYFNGCDTRIRWPKYFIKDGISTIWNHASKKGMDVNLCGNKNETITGFFNYKESERIKLYYELDDFLKKGNFSDSSLSFVGTPDMHTAICDYYATDYAFRKGDEVVGLLFRNYITEDFVSQFDYTIIFSDHGYQTEDEHNKMKSPIELLDDGRNQLFMFIHKKEDHGIKTDDRLASMTDLYATIESLIGCEEMRQGYSLLGKPKREMLHVEDHQDFRVYPEIMIKQWRVISNTFDIRTDVKNTIVSNGNDVDVKKMDAYLRVYSPKYSDYVKQLQVWGYYDTLKTEEGPQYYVGTNRLASFEKYKVMFLHGLRKLITKL